jgi:hypothetical protein
MTHDDDETDLEYSLADLPLEVFTHATGRPLEFDDAALPALPRGLQRVVMIEWFTARYCDPAEDTPYNGREGGYQFIHGGPFDPADELVDRFGGVLDDELIDSAIDHLQTEVSHEWAPLRHYDEAFDVEVHEQGEPFANLARRLAEARLALSLKGDSQAERLVVHWAYSGLITALETYLWETLAFWLDHDDRVLERLVTGFEEFRSRTLKLGDVFKRMSGLRSEVRGYLQGFVWHRWPDVTRLYRAAFEFDPPSFSDFEAPLAIRHDVIHRNSQTPDGAPVVIEAADVELLAQAVGRFAVQMEALLPALPSDFDSADTAGNGAGA